MRRTRNLPAGIALISGMLCLGLLGIYLSRNTFGDHDHLRRDNSVHSHQHVHSQDEIDEKKLPAPQPILGVPAEPKKEEALCRKNFGRIGIFMIFTRYAAYSHASNTLRCYALSKGYEIFVVHAFEDPLTAKACGMYKDVFFRKHCVASYYLEKVDWLYVSDADTAVFNSDHCIEEWLYEKADVIMYERFFTSELVSGNYIVRNSPAGRHFLRGWAAMEFEKPPLESGIFMSADNGFLHIHMIRTVFPEQGELSKRCMGYLNQSIWPNYEPGYGKFVRCTKEALLSQKSSLHSRTNVIVLPRAQAWVRDTMFTGHNLWSGDFMSHGIKGSEPFDEKMLERLAEFANDTLPVECWNPGWKPIFKGAKVISKEQMRKQLGKAGDGMERSGLKPIFADMDFEKCWPDCKPMFRNF